MQAPRLAHLALDAVAIDSMVEIFLGDADEHLQGLVMCATGTLHEDGTQGESGDGAAVAATEELVDESQTHQALTLPEPELFYDHEVNELHEESRGSVLDGEEIVLEGTGHGRILLRGGLDVETETGGTGGLRGGGSEGGNGYLALLEVGEVLDERLDTGGAEEDEHVVVEGLDLLRGEVVADGAVHDALAVVELLRVKELGNGVVVDVAHGYEILLGLVLGHGGQQVVNLTGGAEEDLALAVLHIFLDIQRDSLRDAEILHILRNSDTQLLGEGEEMVNGMARGEDNGSVVQDVHLLGTKVLRRDSLHLDERTEHEFYVELGSDVVVG